ncbi:1447_t:CDS:2 [Entrophospora sp. SA101]|nr:14488_t:CDS:2 [Entrophospora sp. SA101]CAJ0629791.1 1447_t:CDS:2 [Entrophospora sp. SA101]CAJ0847383.1 1563_t:CDS:2 [Entrophospora sp. SA101]CAJ0876558.1 12095_t:CDS:2 [Entrophospora sp. SA101]
MSFSEIAAASIAYSTITELETIHANSDPFSTVYSTISKGSLVSVIVTSNTSKNVLIPAIPYLYKIANQHIPVVIHVSLINNNNSNSNLSDYTNIMALRQTGFALLHSTGEQDTLDMTLIAHSIAIKTNTPILHFFDNSGLQLKEIPLFSHDFIKKFIEKSDVDYYHELISKSENLNTLYLQSKNQSSNNEIYNSNVKINQNGGVDDPILTNGKNEENSVKTNGISSAPDFFTNTTENIFALFKKETGRSYSNFKFFGNNESDLLIVTFGSNLLQNFIGSDFLDFGLIQVRLYRPWYSQLFCNAIPKKSIKKVLVLEQVFTSTTKWLPLYLDVTSFFHNKKYWNNHVPFIIGGQYGNNLNDKSIGLHVKNLLHDLKSAKLHDNINLGEELVKKSQENNINGHITTTTTDSIISNKNNVDAIIAESKLEKPYLNMLNEIFADRLFIANAISKPNAGYFEAIKSTPEFGYGVLISKLQKRSQLVDFVSSALKNEKIPESLHVALSQWILSKDDADKSKEFGETAISLLYKLHKDSQLLTNIYNLKDQFFKPSNWLIGSDLWANDIGGSGVHHVISSGKDINILIIDSQPYTTRTANDPDKRKKDIGLYAMNYGDVYVASVAVYSSYTQVLHALIEAEKYKGPSVVLAYMPYHSENDSPITVLKETKLAVDAGYWPLYRWNPELEKEGKESFTLDSEKIKQELQSFLERENYLTQLSNVKPEISTITTNSLESEIKAKQQSLAKLTFNKLLDGMSSGPPLLILFGSDNGNTEGLARRLQKGAKARGVVARCMAMDEFPIEELSLEKNAVFLCCTAGQGEFPQNAREFWKHISTNTEISLVETKYAVFGLGDSKYWPRAEDIIYYNKPGKELDLRLELLGGQRLLPFGLGDDQDPDGYETGFQAWEPLLWDALNVKLLGSVVEEPKKTDDDMKVESNYLRGSIKEGLEDTSTGALAESDTKLTKFHGIYQQDDRDLREERKAQGLEKAYSFMVRVRVPGGISTAKQWLALDEISEKWTSGSLKLTTRQAYQLHGVLKRNLKLTIRGINKCLLDTLAACGDVNRNVMCNPNPLQSEIHYEVNEFAKNISAHLTPRTTSYHEIWLDDKMVAGQAVQDHEPLYGPTYLPRKFKIAIAIPPNNDVDVFAHDLGYIAIADKTNKKLLGYNVTIGGGMGATHNNKKTYPRLGDVIGFCRPEQAIDVGEKIMLIQRDFGDRTNRKHARFKYTIDDRSIEWFCLELESRLGYKLEDAKEYKFENNADRYGWTKGIGDKWHFCMYIENGRVKDEPGAPIKTGLREIAKIHKGDFRLTPNQHLILGNVSEKDKPNIEKLLKKYALDNLQYTGIRLNSMSCVALPTCGLAMAEAERYLPTLVSKLESIVEDIGLKHNAIVIRMTGCPNGCARPYVAEIACIGKAPGTYNLYLGGGFYGQRLNKLYKESLKEDEILNELKPMLTRYAKEKYEDEKFGDFVIRAGYIKATRFGKDFHDL